MPNPQAGGPPHVGCPRLLMQYICSFPPKLEGVSSIRNLSTRHAIVTRDPPILIHGNNVHTICTGPLSVQAQYSRLCPISSSFHYNSSLVT
jgi:hypothetical protein